MSRSTEAVIAAAVVVAAGCGSGAGQPAVTARDGGLQSAEVGGPADGDGVDGPDDPIEVEASAPDAGFAFCDAYAARWCDRLGACAPVIVLSVFGDGPGCQERVRLDCRIEAARPGSGFDDTGVAACTGALATAACDDVLDDTVSACRPPGRLPVAAACGSGRQCASGFCHLPETTPCGHCAPTAAEGESCDSTDACQFPLRCSRAGRCALAGERGAFCNESVPCRAWTLYCSPGDNTCQRYATVGLGCNEAGPSFVRPCDVGLTCRPAASGSCVAIAYAAAGERCGIPMGSAGQITLCRGSASCLDDVCQAPGRDGEPCTLSPLGEALGCLPPAQCLQGRCKLPDPSACH